MRQLALPGIANRPTRADIKALVRRRLLGLDLRQAARDARRARRRDQAVRAEYRRKEAACP